MRIIVIFFLSVVALSGCDEGSAKKDINHSVSNDSANGPKFECSEGNISFDCNVVSGDQLGSGKWRKAIISLSGSNASLNVDGESFYKDKLENSFFEGTKYTTYKMKGTKGNFASITIENSNSGARLSLNVEDSKGNLMLTASK